MGTVFIYAHINIHTCNDYEYLHAHTRMEIIVSKTGLDLETIGRQKKEN